MFTGRIFCSSVWKITFHNTQSFILMYLLCCAWMSIYYILIGLTGSGACPLATSGSWRGVEMWGCSQREQRKMNGRGHAKCFWLTRVGAGSRMGAGSVLFQLDCCFEYHELFTMLDDTNTHQSEQEAWRRHQVSTNHKADTWSVLRFIYPFIKAQLQCIVFKWRPLLLFISKYHNIILLTF